MKKILLIILTAFILSGCKEKHDAVFDYNFTKCITALENGTECMENIIKDNAHYHVSRLFLNPKDSGFVAQKIVNTNRYLSNINVCPSEDQNAYEDLKKVQAMYLVLANYFLTFNENPQKNEKKRLEYYDKIWAFDKMLRDMDYQYSEIIKRAPTKEPNQ